MFQRDCYGFGGSLHTRLLACHETRWHKDTQRSHANRILTLPDKMRLFLLLPFFLLYFFIPFRARFAFRSVSGLLLKTFILHFSTSKTNREKMNMMRMGINCLVSPAGLRAASLYSLSLRNVHFAPAEINVSAWLWFTIISKRPSSFSQTETVN